MVRKVRHTLGRKERHTLVHSPNRSSCSCGSASVAGGTSSACCRSCDTCGCCSKKEHSSQPELVHSTKELEHSRLVRCFRSRLEQHKLVRKERHSLELLHMHHRKVLHS